MGKQRTLLFVFRRHRTERLRLYAAGQGPDEMLYGLVHAQKSGWVASFFEGNDHAGPPLHRLWRFAEAWIMRQTGIGFALPLAVQHIKLLRAADVIISTVDTCGLPIALLKRIGLLRTPLVYISQGLTNRFEKTKALSQQQRMLKSLYRTVLQAADRIIVLGHGAAEPLIHYFEVPRHKVHVVLFGIDADFWTPGSQNTSEDYILSVGNDRARDYATLVRAAASLRLRIVTTLPLPNHATPNLTVSSGHTDGELRELYRKAACVVVPLFEVSQPAGQSVTLQAMACGKTVILTRTAGLWDPATMQHMHNCILIEPGDTIGLSNALRWCREHPEEAQRIGTAARSTVVAYYTSSRFAQNLLSHAENVLSARLNEHDRARL